MKLQRKHCSKISYQSNLIWGVLSRKINTCRNRSLPAFNYLFELKSIQVSGHRSAFSKFLFVFLKCIIYVSKEVLLCRLILLLTWIKPHSVAFATKVCPGRVANKFFGYIRLLLEAQKIPKHNCKHLIIDSSYWVFYEG